MEISVLHLAISCCCLQLSDGQRQLFCAARALLRRPKILVLDESTADLDQDSANELLRVIDENFRETTVISIAHRCALSVLLTVD